MDNHYGVENKRGVPISLSKNSDEIEIGEADDEGLYEDWAKVRELEILGLEMRHEILSCPVVPNIGVVGKVFFIGRQWIQRD